ncbi:MAG: penicillin-binding transpeptidase domain-containing protein [Bacillota bacterium]|nr:penicillin-binding transpeptidase domain-containing protein [Bacillota bacterium]
MKKIEKRAIMCLLLACVLFVGTGVFTYRYFAYGDEWASYEGNRDLYSEGDLAKGSLYDINGSLLMKNSSEGMQYNDDYSTRCALMHITGDKDNNISTGANRAFINEMVGYDFVNGIYTLNNEGRDLTLTLDADVCAAAYDAMDGRKGTVGVYNYKTGQIICMVSSPTYDPADPPEINQYNEDQYDGVYINRFIDATFVPGSIFKLVTAAAAIETLDDAYSWEITCTGSVDYGHGDEVTDLAVHGTVDLKKALEVSCNCYFGQLAEKLGPGKLEEYVKKAGLSKSIDINGIDTAKSTFDFPDSGVSLAWTGIGQYHDMVNPCSMMVYMGAIANNGTAVMPYIIEPSSLVTNYFKKIPKVGTKTKDMIESSTASSLKDMMANNVENNYGSGNFPGLEICAKSGTAEVGNGNKPNAWFAGFLNDDAHPYAFIVLVENGGYGSEAAGSVANKVLQEAVN